MPRLIYTSKYVMDLILNGMKICISRWQWVFKFVLKLLCKYLFDWGMVVVLNSKHIWKIHFSMSRNMFLINEFEFYAWKVVVLVNLNFLMFSLQSIFAPQTFKIKVAVYSYKSISVASNHNQQDNWISSFLKLIKLSNFPSLQHK